LAATADRGTHHMRARTRLWPLSTDGSESASRDGTTSDDDAETAFGSRPPSPPPPPHRFHHHRQAPANEPSGVGTDGDAAVMCRHRKSLVPMRPSAVLRSGLRFADSAHVGRFGARCCPVVCSQAPLSRAVRLWYFDALMALATRPRPATAELCPVKVLHGPRRISRLGCAPTRRQLHPCAAAPPFDNMRWYCDKVT